jgi:putative endonuclease
MVILKNMYYTYVLRSFRDGKFYIGSTSDLKRRFAEHQQGRNTSTKQRCPLELFFYEAFKARADAERRERYFKTDKGKTTLRQMLREALLEADSISSIHQSTH